MNKESIIKTIKIIVLIPIGIFVLYFFVAYFVNIITIFKLDWYFLIHPSKWFSFDFIWGFPFWEAFAIASITINWYLFLKIIETMFERNYSALKKTGMVVLFIILIPVLTTVADLGQKLVMKHAFDIETKIYAVTGIQDRYTTFLLKAMYGVSDERINQLLAENFFAYLTDEEEQIQAINSLTQHLRDLWWQSEYPALVKAVSSADNSSLSTSYRTGPDGRSQVKLLLLKEPSDGLVFKIELPEEAIFSIDLKTRKNIPSETVHVITIRDHNLDGMLDDFDREPSGGSVYKEERTKDGFIKFRNTPEHQSILIAWSLGIGFSVNHFLHGVDSAVPR